jgi:serine/threonine protein kinase
MQDAARVRSLPELDSGIVLGSLHRGDIVHVHEVRRNAGPNGVHRLRFKWSDTEWGWVSQTASNGTVLLKPASVVEVQAVHAANNLSQTPRRADEVGEPDEASSSALPQPQLPQLRQELLPRVVAEKAFVQPPAVLETEQEQPQRDVLSAFCRKQKPRMRTWHDRHARIEGSGLFFYDSDSLSETQRGSSISNVAGCSIQKGTETFYFPTQTWWKLSLQRDDLLGDGTTALAFRDKKTRDAFAAALTIAGVEAAPSAPEPEPEPEPAPKEEAEPETQSPRPDRGTTIPRIPYEDLTLSETAIGRGQDKTVYLARYQGEDVAALFGEAGTSLEQEAQIFARAGRHPNLIHFWGLAQHGDLQCLVAERAALGSLDQFLEDHGKALLLEAKLSMGSQIAAGMAHLHAQSLIHRDLATRNVLVCHRGDKHGRGAVVKLTDYGLTKEATRSGAYYGSEKRDLPVLWMAPEALQRRKFTEKTDIWAFGVTMWELLTDGSFPYWQWAEPNDAAIIQRVCAGEVMDVPERVNAAGEVEKCPDAVYKLLLATWRFSPEDRPNFETVGAMLVALTT